MHTKNPIQRLIAYIDSKDVSVYEYVFTVFGIILLRIFFENYSSPHASGLFTSGYTTFFHYPLFYLSIGLSILLIVHFFTRIKITSLLRLFPYFFAIILLPPIADLWYTSGAGWGQAYLFQTPAELITSFFTFFGPLVSPGITFGIRLEVIIVLLGTFGFVGLYTKSFWKALFAALASYGVFFVYFALPSLLALPFISAFHYTDLVAFWQQAFSESLLHSSHSLAGLPAEESVLYEQQFNIFFSRIFWIGIILQLIVVSFRTSRSVFSAWVKNLRWERIAYYSLFFIAGIYIALTEGLYMGPFGFVDILAFFVALFALAINFWLAVGVNDLADEQIDKISNNTRPLVSDGMSRKDQQAINALLLAMLIYGALLVNYVYFILAFVYQTIYYIYSSPPLRLRKIFGINVVLVSLNAVVATMMGFYFLSTDQTFTAFPSHIFWFMLIVFAVVVNIKDIKDVAGDKLDGVQTLPVIMGLEPAKKLLAFLTVVLMLSVPLLLENMQLLAVAVVLSGFAAYLLLRKNYVETFVFYIFYAYFIATLFLI